ncbi:MAG: VanZ family protein [Paramuribaculum sp.]|nr:VanZ family protein [Paramuribaculum sp.]
MKKKTFDRLIAAPPFLYSAIIFLIILFLTLAPDVSPGKNVKLFPHADKVVHFLMFGAFSATIVFDGWRKNHFINASLMILAMFCSSFLGGLIEILQDAMGLGRTSDWWDFMADCAGAFVFACFSVYICRICQKKGL